MKGLRYLVVGCLLAAGCRSAQVTTPELVSATAEPEVITKVKRVMLCPNCSAENDAANAFCFKCGGSMRGDSKSFEAEYGPVVVWERPTPAPDWIWKKPEGEGHIFFVGVSTPERYEIKAKERAYNDAATDIARYVFTAAGYRWIDADVGSNAHGKVMIQAIAQKSLYDHFSQSLVRRAYEVENYTRFIREKQYGAWTTYFKRYILFRWSEGEMADLATNAAAQAQEDLRKKYQSEVDAIKKKQLEEATKILDEIQDKGIEGLKKTG